MKWQLSSDWPYGPHIVPSGTILDDTYVWNGSVLPTPLPINATAMDEEAALQMCAWYEETSSIGGWHQLHFAAGIDRQAIFEQARHNRQWPPATMATRATSSSSKEKPAHSGKRTKGD